MLNFMFGVLGSFIFLAIYLGATLFVGTAILKRFSPESFSWVTTGEAPCWGISVEDRLVCTCYLILAFVFWPVFVLYFFVKFIFTTFALQPFCAAVRFADKKTPTINIKTDDDVTE